MHTQSDFHSSYITRVISILSVTQLPNFGDKLIYKLPHLAMQSLKQRQILENGAERLVLGNLEKNTQTVISFTPWLMKFKHMIDRTSCMYTLISPWKYTDEYTSEHKQRC